MGKKQYSGILDKRRETVYLSIPHILNLPPHNYEVKWLTFNSYWIKCLTYVWKSLWVCISMWMHAHACVSLHVCKCNVCVQNCQCDGKKILSQKSPKVNLFWFWALIASSHILTTTTTKTIRYRHHCHCDCNYIFFLLFIHLILLSFYCN